MAAGPERDVVLPPASLSPETWVLHLVFSKKECHGTDVALQLAAEEHGKDKVQATSSENHQYLIQGSFSWRTQPCHHLLNQEEYH